MAEMTMTIIMDRKLIVQLLSNHLNSQYIPVYSCSFSVLRAFKKSSVSISGHRRAPRELLLQNATPARADCNSLYLFVFIIKPLSTQNFVAESNGDLVMRQRWAKFIYLLNTISYRYFFIWHGN